MFLQLKSPFFRSKIKKDKGNQKNTSGKVKEKITNSGLIKIHVIFLLSTQQISKAQQLILNQIVKQQAVVCQVLKPFLEVQNIFSLKFPRFGDYFQQQKVGRLYIEE